MLLHASLPFCSVVADYIPRPGPERNSGNLNESICIAVSMNFYIGLGNYLKNKLIFLASVYHPPNIWTFQVTPFVWTPVSMTPVSCGVTQGLTPLSCITTHLRNQRLVGVIIGRNIIQLDSIEQIDAMLPRVYSVSSCFRFCVFLARSNWRKLLRIPCLYCIIYIFISVWLVMMSLSCWD